MNLPTPYIDKSEWTLIGPMGPKVPDFLLQHPLLGIDGGAHFAEKLDIWVGDKDSFQGEITADIAFQFPIDKNDSDLALAFSLFQKPLSYQLHLWGLLGGRKDHELFNLGEALNFLASHNGSQMYFYAPEGKVQFHLVSSGDWTFNRNGLFSLGSLIPLKFKLTGKCRYEIKEEQTLRPLSSLGLSNFGSGEVKLKTNAPMFIYYPESE